MGLYTAPKPWRLPEVVRPRQVISRQEAYPPAHAPSIRVPGEVSRAVSVKSSVTATSLNSFSERRT